VSATDNFAFTPSSVTVTVGQSVCWQNTGLLMHTVTDNVTNGVRFSGNLPGVQTFVHTFTFGGSFGYHCNNHSNMTGTVMVNCKPGDIVCESRIHSGDSRVAFVTAHISSHCRGSRIKNALPNQRMMVRHSLGRLHLRK
jgi:hypothetical protein